MTSWSGFARARARSSWGLLLTLLALVTVTTAIIAGTVGYSAAAASTAARQALTQGLPTETGVQVQTRLAEDPQAQDEQARGTITESLAPAPVDIGRLVVSEPRPVQQDGAALDGDLVLLGSPDLAATGSAPTDLVTVVEGAWPDVGATTTSGTPDDPAPAALHVGAARAWDLTLGDVLAVGDLGVEVTALWQPVDPQDAFWFGDELVRTGVTDEEATLGPLVTDEELVQQIGAPFVRWPVRPDTDRTTPDDLRTLATGAESLRSTLRDDVEGVAVRGLQVEGDLAPTAGQAATNLATARALGVIPLSVLVLVTGLAVVQLARLLAATREPQAQLLVARGASRAQVLLSGLAESVAVATVGVLLGAALAWGVMQLVPGGEDLLARIAWTALLTLLGICLALAAIAGLQAGRLSGGQAIADRSGRTRAATAIATVVLVLGAAALAWWQLRRAGSPLTRAEDGTLGTDLVAGAAPALLLAAAAVIAMALLGPLSRILELATRRSRATTSHLASAQVSRHLQVYAVPVVLIVLAAGSTTLAALYSGTSAQLRDDLAAVSEGAPLRADLVRPPNPSSRSTLADPPPDLTDLPEIADATLVWLEPDARFGDVVVPLTLADTDRLAGVANVPDGIPAGLVPDGLGEVLAVDGESRDGGPLVVPAGAESLELTLTAERDADRWEIASLDGLADLEAQFYELEQENLDQMSEEERAAAEQVRLSLEEQTTLRLDDAVTGAAQPVEMRVSVLVQDVRTGLTSTVASEDVEVPGPELNYDPQTLRDFAATPATTTEELTFTLPEGREHTIEAMTVEILPPPADQPFFSSGSSTLAADLELTAGGQSLLADAGWGSADVMSREMADPLIEAAESVEEAEVTTILEVDQGYVGDQGVSFSTFTESNQEFVPTWYATSGATWHVEWPNQWLGDPEVTLAPGAEFSGSAPTDSLDDAPTAKTPPSGLVPVAVTDAAAAAASLDLGDALTISLAGTSLQAQVHEVVPAIPGQTGTTAALADARVVSALLAERQRSLTWPTQVWARPVADGAQDGEAGPGVDAAVAALSARDDLRAVTGPGTVAVTDATSAARLVFWVASAGAVLLALTGVAAVAATLLSSRRPEVAVLRALGMPPAAQARSRALELVGVVLVSIAFGLGAGWLVGAAVVRELATSTTQPGRLLLPAALRLEALPWAVLVAAGLLGLAVLATLLSRRVRAQALDRDYREEIR